MRNSIVQLGLLGLVTEEQLHLLAGTGSWELNDVPKKEWENLPDWMNKNCVRIMASGSMDHSPISHGLEVIGDIDWLRFEHKPRPDEPEGNAYHFVVATGSDGQSYLNGPFKNGTLVPHWFNPDDLDNCDL